MKNYDAALFLVKEELRGIVGIYDTPDACPKREHFKTFDPHIQVDDCVVVTTEHRHKLTVVKVVEVDVDPDFDDPTCKVRWIVQRIGRQPHLRRVKMEQEALKIIRASEKRKRRRELSSDVMDEMTAQKLADTLAITNGDPVKRPPPAPQAPADEEIPDDAIEF